MNIQDLTIHAKLVAFVTDGLGYTNYVFENLEYNDVLYKYIMCVRFPNWCHGIIKIGDEGFLSYKYVRGGIDEWFDGENHIKYKYTNFIFMKFVDCTPIKDEDIIVD